MYGKSGRVARRPERTHDRPRKAGQPRATSTRHSRERWEGVRPEDRELLRATALFAPLTPQQFERIAASIVVHGLPKGTLVCKQGERPEFVYVILDGRVALLGEASGKPE